jgi:hypothetical protein
MISLKSPVFEMAKNSGIATNDRFNFVMYLNNFPLIKLICIIWVLIDDDCGCHLSHHCPQQGSGFTKNSEVGRKKLLSTLIYMLLHYFFDQLH